MYAAPVCAFRPGAEVLVARLVNRPRCRGWPLPAIHGLISCGWRRTNNPSRAEAPMARVATLDQLHRPPGWLCVYCARYAPLCQHRAPMALAPLIIRWGPETSGDMLRRCARCTKCGHKGATAAAPRLDRERRRLAVVPGRWVDEITACWNFAVISSLIPQVQNASNPDSQLHGRRLNPATQPLRI